jgi:hypothetical protein
MTEKKAKLSWRELSSVEVLESVTDPGFRPDCEVSATERLMFILRPDFFSGHVGGDDHPRE